MINRNIFKKTEPTDLENEIAKLFVLLNSHDADSDEYDKVTDQIKKLYPLKETDSKRQVSGDVLVGAAVNLLGILVIVNKEYLHVVNSKAMGLIGRKITG